MDRKIVVMHFIYLGSCPIHEQEDIYKIGCSHDPHQRKENITGVYPPTEKCAWWMRLWETTAHDHMTMEQYEHEVHAEFATERLTGPRHLEFFRLESTDLTRVEAFITSRPWFVREWHLEDIPRKSRLLSRPEDRMNALCEIQRPIIENIRAFVHDVEMEAAHIVAPCGSGKTVMTCRGVVDIRRLIVCCPSLAIRGQWRETMIREGNFTQDQIVCLTTPSMVPEILEQSTYCILCTYASSHHLLDWISTENTDGIVMDEVHHMGGMVTPSEEGRTRRLLQRAAKLGIKRFSMTFTPRFMNKSSQHRHMVTDMDTAAVMSMDDETIFGQRIGNLDVRHLIDRGILPDYRLWCIENMETPGLDGKISCLVRCWEEMPFLHHLIVFAEDNHDADQCYNILRARFDHVFRVRGGDQENDATIRAFEAVEGRAILVNCRVIHEGVDIPIANAVAFLCRKHSQEEIIQMAYRPGRWFRNKLLFHILHIATDKEDREVFDHINIALASVDSFYLKEMMTRFVSKKKDPSGPLKEEKEKAEEENLLVLHPNVVEFDWQRLRERFELIRTKMMNTPYHVATLCHQKNIATSVDYKHLRDQIQELPLDPRPPHTTWYDFLHPEANKISIDDVRSKIAVHDIRCASDYKTRCLTPSIQNILDGYFPGIDSFHTLLSNNTYLKTRR